MDWKAAADFITSCANTVGTQLLLFVMIDRGFQITSLIIKTRRPDVFGPRPIKIEGSRLVTADEETKDT